MDKTAPSVRIILSKQPDALDLSYEIRNDLDYPIYVFDRLYDQNTQQLSPDWAYISFADGCATFSRQVWPLPPGLVHEEPQIPYARLVPPKSIATGEIKIKLPLLEYHPYRGFLATAGKRLELKLNRTALQIGWIPEYSLKGGSPVELNGEKLVLFDYHAVIANQKLSSSPTQGNLDLPGITVR